MSPAEPEPTVEAALSLAVQLRDHAPARVTLTQRTAGRVRIAVHDVAGRLVASLWDGWLSAGTHDFDCVACDARHARAVYFVTATAGDARVTRKLVLR